MYCVNCQARMFKYLSYLPVELLEIIYSYLPNQAKIFLNRDYYKKYHYLLRDMISPRNYDNYIRDMIKNNCTFVITQLMDENYKQWIQSSKKMYKNVIYPHYSGYIIGMALEMNRNSIRELVVEYYDKKGLSKNLHKKNRSNNKRWIK